MTEAEAKTKWCPFARQVWKSDGGADLSMNRDGAGSPTAFCIGSACMAWHPTTENRGAWGTHVPNGGYCGLSGDPRGTRDGSYAK